MFSHCMGAKTEFTETEDKRKKNIKETKQTLRPRGKKMHVHLRNRGVNRFRDKAKLPSPEQPCVGIPRMYLY